MKYLSCLILFFFGVAFSIAGQQKMVSGIYDFEKIPSVKTSYGETQKFFSSPSRSLENFSVNLITMNPGKSTATESIKDGTDRLIIIREGTAEIRINNQKQLLGEGSVVVVSAGDSFTSRNTSDKNTSLYLIDFKPAKNTGSGKILPLFIDWKDVKFVPSANGGRRGIMQQPTSFMKELEIHVTTLKEGLPSHSAHVHADEEIILLRKGFAEETIRGKAFNTGAGSIIFLTNDDLHGISNAGKAECEYYAIRWLTE
jgi:mannose-6-phosphate isomerase-like protein (cupin superfamily)